MLAIAWNLVGGCIGCPKLDSPIVGDMFTQKTDDRALVFLQIEIGLPANDFDIFALWRDLARPARRAQLHGRHRDRDGWRRRRHLKIDSRQENSEGVSRWKTLLLESTSDTTSD